MRWIDGALAGAIAACLVGCTQGAPFVAPTPAALFPATACPSDLGTLQDVAAPAHGSDRLLNARPSPSTAVVCEYGSTLDEDPGRGHPLAEQLRLPATAAGARASAAAAIDAGTAPGSNACPEDSGRVTVIAFGYRSAPPVDLWWHSTGCRTLTAARQPRPCATTTIGSPVPAASAARSTASVQSCRSGSCQDRGTIRTASGDHACQRLCQCSGLEPPGPGAITIRAGRRSVVQGGHTVTFPILPSIPRTGVQERNIGIRSRPTPGGW